MALISLKCPYCNGDLVFDAKTRMYQCPYCLSKFIEGQVERIADQNPAMEDRLENGLPREKEWEENDCPETEGPVEADELVEADEPKEGDREADEPVEADEPKEGDHKVKEPEEAPDLEAYTCPNCGAEILAGVGAKAIHCCYCHTPATRSGKVSVAYRPAKIVPFSIEQKEAERLFFAHASKRSTLKKSLQMEHITGVYFPYWQVNWTGNGSMMATATKNHDFKQDGTKFRKVERYELYRKAEICFPNMTKRAFEASVSDFIEDVQPYDLDSAVPFSTAFLSGYQAEKGEREQKEAREEIRGDIQQYAEVIFKDTMCGYHSVAPARQHMEAASEEWQSLWLPVWILPYRKGKDSGYFVMNGQTGKICSQPSVDNHRSTVVSAAAGALVGILLLIGGWLIW